MSCGNRFVCGMRRFDKYKVSSDRPNNPILHNENEQKLHQLLKEREEFNTQLYPSITPITISSSTQSLPPLPSSFYTPWKTPSSQ